MKVCWITNTAFSHHRTMLGLDPDKVTGGSWLYAAYDSSKAIMDLQLHIATVGDVNNTLEGEKDGNKFYILPGRNSKGYDIRSSRNFKEWKRLREHISPDIVIVWGTETRFAYLAMKAMEGIPCVIFIQGVIGSIFEHYYDGIPYEYRYSTLRDLFDKYSARSEINTFKKQVLLEKEMFRMAHGVIIENDWCEDISLSYNRNIHVYKALMPIREVFQDRRWSIEMINRHTIFTNAGGYPIKGHHILFKALSIVKNRYPDVKCIVPGVPIETLNTRKRKTGYIKLLTDIIRKNDLSENIIYTGNLSSEQMIMYLETSHVFVMPSVMENQSSSLIEAMMVGIPCITSLVGGVGQYVKNKNNALIFNSLDAESLAGLIIRVFQDDQLANALSIQASRIKEERACTFGKRIITICKQVISETRCS